MTTRPLPTGTLFASGTACSLRQTIPVLRVCRRLPRRVRPQARLVRVQMSEGEQGKYAGTAVDVPPR